MKRVFLLLTVLPLICTGCMTHILTVSPDFDSFGTYTTSVTVPKKHTVVTTTRAIAASDDISLYLDLQAVAAAFAQSSSVQEFERILNNASYMLSNLDLNRDGYVDYLRVLETVEGRAHVFLIQAVLAHNIYQDVATVVAEVSGRANAHVQVIGAEYLYGPRFIIQPTFIAVPAIFAHLIKPSYKPWSSPYYWEHFPTYYKRPVPVYLTHYQAYVTTFMTNHRYCHEVVYVNEVHYPDYDRVSRPAQRRDYEAQHPEGSFKERTADIPSRSAEADRPTATREATSVRETQARPANARDVRERQAAETVTTVTSTSRRSASQQTSSSPRSSASQQTQQSSRSSASQQTQQSSGRSDSQTVQPSASRQTDRQSPATRPDASQTTVRSRVSNSGSADTKIQTVTPSGSTTSTRRASTESGSSSSRRSSEGTATTSSSRNGAAASQRR